DAVEAAGIRPPRCCISSSLCLASERLALASKFPILVSTGDARRLKAYRQSGKAPEPQVISPHHGTRLQFETRQTPNDGLQGFLTFHPRQSRTETEMSSVSKGEVPIIGTAHIKTIGIREALRVAVGR